MANTYRPYSLDEIRAAAAKHGIDPQWLEAIYAVESSRGTNPSAMNARKVQRKRDTTFVRGPFQLEDDTVSDYLRKNKLPPNTDLSDPAVYIDVAAGVAADKLQQAGGDYGMASERYLGTGKDELGTTTGQYRNRIMKEMDAIRRQSPAEDSLADITTPAPAPERTPLETITPYMNTAMGADEDIYGIPNEVATQRAPRESQMGTVSWKDFLADARGPDLHQPISSLGIPEEMGGDDLPAPSTPAQGDFDIDAYLASIVNEQMSDRDFSNAA